MKFLDKNESFEPSFLLEGAALLVDKPEGWTSFDLVNKVRSAIRKATGVKKVKVGHSGTLDPMATGLLIVCTGSHTKKLADFQLLGKSYSGTIKLGATTPSYDRETPIDETYPTDHITLDMLDETRRKLTGEQEQYPPMFSAIKVDGQPLYKKARAGKVVEVTPRPVNIYEFELTKIEMPRVDFFVRCSKGTYVRSLAYDFGKLLSSGGYLTRLERLAIGEFKLQNAWHLEDLVREINWNSNL
jgi:tRNA pseudouridine55 synthase